MQVGSDVFNALDVMENSSILEELKFGKGDGNLHYYFYNWKCPELAPEKVSKHGQEEKWSTHKNNWYNFCVGVLVILMIHY